MGVSIIAKLANNAIYASIKHLQTLSGVDEWAIAISHKIIRKIV